MKKSIYLFVSFVIILFRSPALQAQIKGAELVEKIEHEVGKYGVPYTKYKLANGLVLIVHEDHSDPIVHVKVFYHVGSNRDENGRSGFAHFFEHMMFEGSDHVGPGELQKIIQNAGGTSNGSTSVDRTEYHETVPSNYLETVLWLEADRMGFFLDAVTEKKFENQRATVKNERQENIENKPYGRAGEKEYAAMYPAGSPYSTPPIGYIEDIDRANVNELKHFFLRWYCPNNATLVIAGDVNTEEALRLTEKYFGSIKPGPPAPKLTPVRVNLRADRYISYADNIRNPRLILDYPTVPTHTEDEAALDALAEIIGSGSHSILGGKFYTIHPRASNYNASHPCNEGAGMFNIELTLLPNENLAVAKKDVLNALDYFEKRGVKEEDLIKFKSGRMKRFFDGINTISGKAEHLGYFEWMFGNPDMFQSEYERYQNVTKEDIMRVYRQYIKDKPAVILSIYPEGKAPNVAGPDNYTTPARPARQPEDSLYASLVYTKSKDDFDRSVRPVPGPDPVVRAPEIWQDKLDNGLKLEGIYNNEIPYVTIRLSINAGHTREDWQLSGIGALTARMITSESTKFNKGGEYANELERIGSSILLSTNFDDIQITIISSKKYLERTLAIFSEKLLYPKFEDKEFQWEKSRQLDRIGIQSKSPSVIADQTFDKLMYGSQSVLGIPILGTTSTVNQITRRAVQKYYKTYFRPNNSILTVTGDITKEELLQKISFLKDWKPRALKGGSPAVAPKGEKTRLYFLSRESSAQSEVRIGSSALRYDPLGEQFKCSIMNRPLGTGFSSRINQNLREDKGFTYGAQSSFFAGRYEGQFIASSSVKTNQTDSAVVLLMNEIKNYANQGASEKEVEEAKRSFALSEALRYESPEQKVAFLWRLVFYNLAPDYISTQREIVNSMSRTDINALAKKYLPYENMIILVVGDKSVLPKLQILGYPVTIINTDGRALAE